MLAVSLAFAKPRHLHPLRARRPSAAPFRATMSTADVAPASAPPKPLPRLLPGGAGGGSNEGIYALLFDMDGTLCDTDPIHHEVFADLLQRHGKNGGARIDDDFFRAHIAGRTNEAIFGDLFPELDPTEHERMAEAKELEFRNLAESKLERLPGLTQLLAWASNAGIRVVAVTNAPRPNAELMLRALRLEDAFEHLVIGTECARAKPHPDPYLRGMELVGATDASRCVAFEDSPTGLGAAVAAGCRRWGCSPRSRGTRWRRQGEPVRRRFHRAGTPRGVRGEVDGRGRG